MFEELDRSLREIYREPGVRGFAWAVLALFAILALVFAMGGP